MNRLFLFLCLVLSCSVLEIRATELRLPAILGNHMVLQQQSKVAVWGWAKAGSVVSVKASWAEKNRKVSVAADGTWKLNISTPVAGGPYEIAIRADTTIILKDVMIGEVWVCSGQSNMQMPMYGYVGQPVRGSNDYIAHGNNKNIRLFTVKKSFSKEPQTNCEGSWSVSSPEEVGNFSAVAYIFGKYIQEILGVPIGLIHSSWGGTRAEAWTDAVTLKSDIKDVDLFVINAGKIDANFPTVLFNAMINPILNYGIRGVIWYQGEANATNPERYSRLFPAMIKDWRTRWNQGDFPFYFVQTAPFQYDTLTNAAFLREVQLKTMLNVPNTGMAVTLDIGDKYCWHPAEKILVGKRLAYWALAKTYGEKGLPCSGPVLKEMTVEGNNVCLSFNYADFGLSSFGKEAQGFVVAGVDRLFHPAHAFIGRDFVKVWSDEVEKPVAVRYCWENYTVGTLYNVAELPASSFRTDNWDK